MQETQGTSLPGLDPLSSELIKNSSSHAPTTLDLTFTSEQATTYKNSRDYKQLTERDMATLTHHGVSVWSNENSSEHFSHILHIVWQLEGFKYSPSDRRRTDLAMLRSACLYEHKTRYPILELFKSASSDLIGDDSHVFQLLLEDLYPVIMKKNTDARFAAEKQQQQGSVEARATLVRHQTAMFRSVYAACEKLRDADNALREFALGLIQKYLPPLDYNPHPMLASSGESTFPDLSPRPQSKKRKHTAKDFPDVSGLKELEAAGTYQERQIMTAKIDVQHEVVQGMMNQMSTGLTDVQEKLGLILSRLPDGGSGGTYRDGREHTGRNSDAASTTWNRWESASAQRTRMRNGVESGGWLQDGEVGDKAIQQDGLKYQENFVPLGGLGGATANQTATTRKNAEELAAEKAAVIRKKQDLETLIAAMQAKGSGKPT